jgi:cytochrome P450
VRVGPDHLSLDGSVAWPDVYSHRSGGREEWQKAPGFFPNHGKTLISAPRETHRRMRRQLGHAFSDASLGQQEPIIKIYVDLLLQRLEERAKSGQEINIVDWLNFTTFDIIGDLTFSDPFHSLETNNYHPWVLSIFKGIRGQAMSRFIQSYPLLNFVTKMLPQPGVMKTNLVNTELAEAKAMRRIDLGVEPKSGHLDFMTYMLKKTRDGGTGMSQEEIVLTSPVLVVAGSETTATALSGLFFFLGRNKRVCETLKNEIRSSFTNEEEITMRSSLGLEYLHACLEETLRMYPPAVEIPPRSSPGDMIDGRYVPVGVRVPPSRMHIRSP